MVFGQRLVYTDGTRSRTMRMTRVFQFLTCVEGYVFREYVNTKVLLINLFLARNLSRFTDVQVLGNFKLSSFRALIVQLFGLVTCRVDAKDAEVG